MHIIRDIALSKGYGWKKIIPFKNYLVSLMNFGLGLTPLSVPMELFEEELGAEWKKMKQNLPELLKNLGLHTTAPRELPPEALIQIKKMLELAGINKTLEKFEDMEKRNND